jgi:hypothetical protein
MRLTEISEHLFVALGDKVELKESRLAKFQRRPLSGLRKNLALSKESLSKESLRKREVTSLHQEPNKPCGGDIGQEEIAMTPS